MEDHIVNYFEKLAKLKYIYNFNKLLNLIIAMLFENLPKLTISSALGYK